VTLPHLHVQPCVGKLLAKLTVLGASSSLTGRRVSNAVELATSSGAPARTTPAAARRRFATLLYRLGIKHSRTRPYTPRTNGRAERFIQTLLCEWADAFIYPSSDHRAQELQPWIYHYNFHRPYSAPSYRPPITRLGFEGNNVLRN
jgi:transposase InsO family protein